MSYCYAIFRGGVAITYWYGSHISVMSLSTWNCVVYNETRKYNPTEPNPIFFFIIFFTNTLIHINGLNLYSLLYLLSITHDCSGHFVTRFLVCVKVKLNLWKSNVYQTKYKISLNLTNYQGMKLTKECFNLEFISREELIIFIWGFEMLRNICDTI